MNRTTLAKQGTEYWKSDEMKQWERNMVLNDIQNKHLMEELKSKQFKNKSVLSPFVQTYIQQQLMQGLKQTPQPPLYEEKVKEMKQFSSQLEQLDFNIKQNQKLLQNQAFQQEAEDGEVSENNDKIDLNWAENNNGTIQSSLPQKQMKKPEYKQRPKSQNQQMQEKQKMQQIRAQSGLSQQNWNNYLQQLYNYDISKSSQKYTQGGSRLNFAQRDQHLQNSEIYIRNVPTYDCDPDNSLLLQLEEQFQNLNLKNIQDSKQAIMQKEKRPVNEFAMISSQNKAKKKQFILNNEYPEDLHQVHKEALFILQGKQEEANLEGENKQEQNQTQQQQQEQEEKQKFVVKAVSNNNTRQQNNQIVNGNDSFLITQVMPQGRLLSPSKQQKSQQNYTNFPTSSKKSKNKGFVINNPLYLNHTNRIMLSPASKWAVAPPSSKLQNQTFTSSFGEQRRGETQQAQKFETEIQNSNKNSIDYANFQQTKYQKVQNYCENDNNNNNLYMKKPIQKKRQDYYSENKLLLDNTKSLLQQQKRFRPEEKRPFQYISNQKRNFSPENGSHKGKKVRSKTTVYQQREPVDYSQEDFDKNTFQRTTEQKFYSNQKNLKSSKVWKISESQEKNTGRKILKDSDQTNKAVYKSLNTSFNELMGNNKFQSQQQWQSQNNNNTNPFKVYVVKSGLKPNFNLY